MKHRIISDNNSGEEKESSFHENPKCPLNLLQLKKEYQQSINAIQSMNINNSFDGILEQLMIELEKLNRINK